MYLRQHETSQDDQRSTYAMASPGPSSAGWFANVAHRREPARNGALDRIVFPGLWRGPYPIGQGPVQTAKPKLNLPYALPAGVQGVSGDSIRIHRRRTLGSAAGG